MKSATPVQDIIDNVLPTWVVKLYLVLIAWVLLLAANALFTGMSRHVFSMARDGELPFSSALSRTRVNGVPWVASLVICVLSSLPLIVVTSDLTVLVTGAIAAMYVPYVLVMAVSLWARLRGWPHGEPAPFSLGRWGIPVNVAGLVCAALTLLNLAWGRDTTNPVWKLDIRVTYWLIGIPLVIGLIYYPLKQHRRLDHAPERGVAELVERSVGGDAGPAADRSCSSNGAANHFGLPTTRAATCRRKRKRAGERADALSLLEQVLLSLACELDAQWL